MVQPEQPSPLQIRLPAGPPPVFNYLVQSPIIVENGLNAIERLQRFTKTKPVFEYYLPGFKQLITGDKDKRFNVPDQDMADVPDTTLGRNGRIEDALHKAYSSSRHYDDRHRGVLAVELHNNHRIALRGWFRHDHIGPPVLGVDLGNDYYQYPNEQVHQQGVARVTADLLLRRLVHIDGPVMFEPHGLQPSR